MRSLVAVRPPACVGKRRHSESDDTSPETPQNFTRYVQPLYIRSEQSSRDGLQKKGTHHT